MKKQVLQLSLLAITACFALTSCRSHKLSGGANPDYRTNPDAYAETNLELKPIGNNRISYTLDRTTPEGKRLLKGRSLKEAVDMALTMAAEKYNCDRLIDSRHIPEVKGRRVVSVRVTGRPAVLVQKGATSQPQTTSSSIQQTTSTASQMVTHTVEVGDTLGKIAKRYGVTVNQIIKWNNLTSSTLQPGMKLLLQFE